MPYPQNVETALKVEQIIRENGAVPATIAILGGRLKAGLHPRGDRVPGQEGPGRRPRPAAGIWPCWCARGEDGATTVTTTMMIAHMAGIKIFATGGIGGVHRGAETTMDISADLEELANTPVMVVCAGAKSILDLGLTLEYLETHGVPVHRLRHQGAARLLHPEERLRAWTTAGGHPRRTGRDLPRHSRSWACKGGMLVTNPIPEEYSMDPDVINKAIDEAIAEAKEQGIHGKATTPFLLAKVKELTGGDSLDSNIQLVYNNAALAAKTACELCKMD